MIVIATNNGIEFLPDLIESLKGLDYLVVDTGSTDQKSLDYVETLNHTHRKGGYTLGALEHAYKHFPDEWYFIMHDSMIVKNKNFIEKFKSKGDVVAWLRFPMFFDDANQEAFVRATNRSMADYGIFGPIMYITRDKLKEIELVIPENVEQSRANERGIACALKDAQIGWKYIDDLYPIRWDEHEDFTKKFKHRI